MSGVLAQHRYGKAEVRLVRIARGAEGAPHTLADLTVRVMLTGDFAESYVAGDNSSLLPTDSQKNTVYAFALEHVGPSELLALRLARHFVTTHPPVGTARVVVAERLWRRLGPHSFELTEAESRIVEVEHDGAVAHVTSGLSGLALLNTTDSEFVGYMKDEYTTLAESKDRILATTVEARWRHDTATVETRDDWEDSYAGARSALVTAFVDTYSCSLQQTLHAMGTTVLEQRPELVEIRLSMRNQHHLLVDLAPFGLDNPGDVFVPLDRPYGLVEATLVRADMQDDDPA